MVVIHRDPRDEFSADPCVARLPNSLPASWHRASSFAVFSATMTCPVGDTTDRGIAGWRLDLPLPTGPVAQLVERTPRTGEVRGSTPLWSTRGSVLFLAPSAEPLATTAGIGQPVGMGRDRLDA